MFPNISLANGSFSYSQSLLQVPGIGLPFEFAIAYNSEWDEKDTLGQRWTHNYNWYFGYRPWDLVDDDTSDIRLRTGSGTALYFTRRNPSTDPPGLFFPKYGTQEETLQYRSDRRWEYRNKQQIRYLFDVIEMGNRLLSITDANGNQLTFEYDSQDLRLQRRVIDTRGQTADYFYNARGDLERLEYRGVGGELLNTVSLNYGLATPADTVPVLISVVDASNVTTAFSYDDLGPSGRSRNLIEKIEVSYNSGLGSMH